MNKPIPVRLRNEFFREMASADDSLPDGAWFATLETTAQEFMTRHNLTEKWRCPNDATMQYLLYCAKENE